MARVIIHLKDGKVHHVQANSNTKVEIREYLDAEYKDIAGVYRNDQGGSALNGQYYVLMSIPSVRDV